MDLTNDDEDEQNENVFDITAALLSALNLTLFRVTASKMTYSCVISAEDHLFVGYQRRR